MIISSREFNREMSRIKKESLKTPVIVTERGTPKHVLLSYESYQQLLQGQQKKSAADLLSSEDSVDDSEFANLMSKANITLISAEFY